ncbi:MAG: flagellar hook-length control protein FliK [Zoogloea oleivorans]|jgi:flagellar hook-length control protein FliK|uniref:flagellar hook-length control protein FliK n=2 Tax=Zoogloea TaxID=349 RepID=UPI002A35ED08|nr:flagellar hook-length control protein FliK [Zoogloea oleivorans]MDY0036691.1 flagellar hook-length control protein FliK [Zoogloea oleivorans]
MSGPALNPIANIVPVAPAKGTEATRQDASPPEAADAPGKGFASELHRQMNGDTKKDDSTETDSKATAEADAAAIPGAEQAAAAIPVQPELAALLAGMMQPAVASTPAGRLSDDPAQLDLTTRHTPVEDSAAEVSSTALATLTASALTTTASATTPTTTAASPQSPADFAESLAASLSDPAGTATRANAAELGASLSDPAGTATRANAAELGASLGDPARTTTWTNTAEFSASLSDPAGTATRANAAELGATPAGKAAELIGEAAPTNSFANIHAAALANMRGEASQPPAPSPIPLHVATPAGSPGWPEEVGNRVSWMVGNEESHAHLTLTPPQLGKVEVSITVNGDQTTAQFVAATPAARELIEQSLPRLREILEQSGINLGQTDVGTSGQPGSSGEGRRGNTAGSNRGGDDKLAASTTPAQWVRRGEGLVDTFA